MRFRFQRSGLQESLATTVVVTSLEELRQHINDRGGYLDKLVPQDTIKFIPMGILMRHGLGKDRWETHTVTVNGQAIGFSDGIVLPDTSKEVITKTLFPVKFDPSKFQAWTPNAEEYRQGQTPVTVQKLNRGDLEQLICASMLTIQRMQDLARSTAADIHDVAEAWHNNVVEDDPTLHDEVRGLLMRAKNIIDSEGRVHGYLDQAREKVLSAMNALDADERSPTR